MVPTYVAEFQKWRDGTVAERGRIAREQIRRYAPRDLLPLLAGEAAKVPPRDRREMVTWARTLLKAARDWRGEVRLLAAMQSLGQI